MIVVGMVASVAVNMGGRFLGFDLNKILIGLMDRIVILKDADRVNIVLDSFKQLMDVMAF